MPTTTDDVTNALLQAWDDVDRWLVDEEFVVAVNPDGPAADLASRWPPTSAT